MGQCFGAKEANQHARQKEELRQEVIRSRAGVHVGAHPLSPCYVPKDPSEGEVGEEHADDDTAEEEEFLRASGDPPVVILSSWFMNNFLCFRPDGRVL